MWQLRKGGSICLPLLSAEEEDAQKKEKRKVRHQATAGEKGERRENQSWCIF